MTVNNRKLYDVQFTFDELNALKCAERAITDVIVLFGPGGALVASETGERVEMSELNRVRAILDFFQDHRIFERI